MPKLFRLVAWNIRAGGGTRISKISDSILELAPDVLILSEYRATPPSQEISRILNQAGYKHQSCTTSQVASGRNALLIAARSPIERIGLRNCPTEPGRWTAVKLCNPILTVAGMHVPNQHTGRKPEYHDAVLTLMRRWNRGPAVFAGDTNSGRRGEDEETSVFNNKTTAWFDQINEAGWRDAYRLIHGSKREFTWYSPGHDNGFRLDQAFVSPELIERVTEVRHLWVKDKDQLERRDAVSDHAALVIEFDTAGMERNLLTGNCE